MFLKILQNSSKDIYSLLVVLSLVSEIPKILFWFMSLELLLKNINMSQNSQNNSINDDKYKKFFYNTENLENIYNILKGEDKQLKKETIKRLIQDFEGVEYDDIKDENKNVSNNISPSKLGNSSKDKDLSGINNNTSGDNNSKDINQNNILGTSETEDKTTNSDYISFEEFCNIFKNIYESSQSPNKIFLEGFCYMDKDK